MILGFISTEGTLLVCPKDTVVVMVNGFGKGLSNSATQHSHSHFPQEMHFLVAFKISTFDFKRSSPIDFNRVLKFTRTFGVFTGSGANRTGGCSAHPYL